MDSSEMEAFLAVARTGNISAAAPLVHITQSALSKRIKSLEEFLEVELFDRRKGQKSMELTLAGSTFLELAQRWQGLWHDMHSLRGQVLQVPQALHIGVLDWISPLLVQLVSTLSAIDPPMLFRLSTLHSFEMYDEIDKRVIDVGFSLLERQMPSVQRRQIFSEPFVVLCAEPNPAGGKGFLRPEDLDADTELFSAWWSPGYVAWHEHHWELRRSLRLRVNSMYLMTQLLGTLGQWTIVPYSAARQASKKQPFVMYRLDPEPPPCVWLLLTHKQPRTNAKEALMVFDKYLEASIRDLQPC